MKTNAGESIWHGKSDQQKGRIVTLSKELMNDGTKILWILPYDWKFVQFIIGKVRK